METQQETRQEAVIQPIENIVQSGDEGMFTTSLIIAQAFEKEHKDVLKAISNLECSSEFNERNFAPVEYKDAKGEMRPAYRITRDGFCFLAMGFTGKKAAEWKEKFLEAFNAMERMLPRLVLPFSRPPRESETVGNQRKSKLIRGMAAYWAFVEKIPFSVAEFSVCASLGISRLDGVNRENFDAAFEYLWFAVHRPTYGTDKDMATREQAELLRHMLTACAQFRFSHDQDFEKVFKSLSGMKVRDISSLSFHDAEKMLSIAGCLLHRVLQWTLDRGDVLEMMEA